MIVRALIILFKAVVRAAKRKYERFKILLTLQCRSLS